MNPWSMGEHGRGEARSHGALRMTEVPKVNRDMRFIRGLGENTNCFLLRSSALWKDFSQGCTEAVGTMGLLG